MTRKDDADHAIYSAPWRELVDGEHLGPEYWPLSVRSGRMVAQATAEHDYDEAHGPVHSPGLWDYDQERRMGPRRAPLRPQREDAERMAAYVARYGGELTTREWEVYTLFWAGRLSYAETARKIGTRRERIHEAVKRLRRKLALAGRR